MTSKDDLVRFQLIQKEHGDQGTLQRLNGADRNGIIMRTEMEMNVKIPGDQIGPFPSVVSHLMWVSAAASAASPHVSTSRRVEMRSTYLRRISTPEKRVCGDEAVQESSSSSDPISRSFYFQREITPTAAELVHHQGSSRKTRPRLFTDNPWFYTVPVIVPLLIRYTQHNDVIRIYIIHFIRQREYVRVTNQQQHVKHKNYCFYTLLCCFSKQEKRTPSSLKHKQPE